MKPIEIITIILVVLFLGFVIIRGIVKKKKGKIGCSDCSTCTLNCNKTSLIERYRKDHPKKDQKA